MSSKNRIQYVDKLGERLFKTCEFRLGDSVIEYYGECICKCGCRRWVQNIETWSQEIPKEVKICPICHLNCNKIEMHA